MCACVCIGVDVVPVFIEMKGVLICRLLNYDYIPLVNYAILFIGVNKLRVDFL